MSCRIGVVKIIGVKWIVTSSTKIVEQSIEYFINRPSMEMHIFMREGKSCQEIIWGLSGTSYDILLISKKSINLARNIE